MGEKVQVSIDRDMLVVIISWGQEVDFEYGLHDDELVIMGKLKAIQAEPEETDICGECYRPVTLTLGGAIAYHTMPDHPDMLPNMPCQSSGTHFYVSRNCVCERVIDECRCGSGERD